MNPVWIDTGPRRLNEYFTEKEPWKLHKKLDMKVQWENNTHVYLFLGVVEYERWCVSY